MLKAYNMIYLNWNGRNQTGPWKCEVIRVTKLKNPFILHNAELKSTENAKYLGVTISNDFNWKLHIENMTTP